MQEMKEARTMVKDWRRMFEEEQLEKAEKIIEEGEFAKFSLSSSKASACIRIHQNKGIWFRPKVNHIPQSYSDDWYEKDFSCSCRNKKGRVLCSHQAALLILCEREHGIWEFTETEEERARCLKEKEREKERERRLEQRRIEGYLSADVTDILPSHRNPLPYYDLNRLFESKKTGLYEKNIALEILRNGTIEMDAPYTYIHPDGNQVMVSNALIFDGLDYHKTKVNLSYNKIYDLECTCTNASQSTSIHPICEHILALLRKTWDYIEKKDPGDATDSEADNFFNSIKSFEFAARERKRTKKRPKNVTLIPRISCELDTVRLTFHLKLPGEKPIKLKNHQDFVSALEKKEVFDLNRTKLVDFSRVDITDESVPWFSFIQQWVGENSQVKVRSRGNETSTEIVRQDQYDLSGDILDMFYDLAENTICEYQNRILEIESTIHVGYTETRISLNTKPIMNEDEYLRGIIVTGHLPQIIKGSCDYYVLDDSHLSRMTYTEQKIISPFRRTTSVTGNIRFKVGRSKLPEFYYRTVPAMQESGLVEINDPCFEAVKKILPPSPSFLFRLDLEGENCICRESVSYGDRTCSLPRTASTEIQRDLEEIQTEKEEYFDEIQENRVERIILRHFSVFDSDRKCYIRRDNDPDETLYRILTEALPELSLYGSIQGSKRFCAYSIRSVPAIYISVAIKDGLIGISIHAEDLSSEEFLSILRSYRQKKEYHRLENGNYIRLDDDGQLSHLKEFARSMEFHLEDAIQGEIHLPAFRALYLNYVLDTFNDLFLYPDPAYRSLMKSFHWIENTEYEPAEDLRNILRPYQLYGYKWMSILTAAGYGGILADQEGLGKKLQIVSLIASFSEQEMLRPSLIVCPSSLVYEWQEEFSHFSSHLSVSVVKGSSSERKKLINEKTANVYITDFDLLRKDILLYQNQHFYTMILDEARSIKSQNSILTQAVKSIIADCRFALTEPFIENRLEELWSIFDFLMPGLLYDYEEFVERFETPIRIEGDAFITQQLRQIVSPFILQRLKEDVLEEPSKTVL